MLVRQRTFQEIPKDKIPQDAQKVGAMLMQPEPGRPRPIPIRVQEVKDKTIVVDFNHPAGRQDAQLRR